MEVLAFSVAISHENEEIRKTLYLISLQKLTLEWRFRMLTIRQ
jgi:hypothetical protein